MDGRKSGNRMFPLFRAIVKFCSTNKLFTYIDEWDLIGLHISLVDFHMKISAAQLKTLISKFFDERTHITILPMVNSIIIFEISNISFLKLRDKVE